jgi:hypothetical protein
MMIQREYKAADFPKNLDDPEIFRGEMRFIAVLTFELCHFLETVG